VSVVHRRQLRGKDRQRVAEAAESSSPQFVGQQNMANIAPSSLHAGNLTECPTTVVVRKALHGLRRKHQISDDMTYELMIMKSTLSSCCGDNIKGYIQSIGVDPFLVVFYLEQQLQYYVKRCKTGALVVHMDCTGSVMRSVPQQKRPYYYALVADEGSLPLCEFITTRHYHAWIMTNVEFFLTHAADVNGGRRITPYCVVVDFSFAMIHAMLLAFNRCSLTRYLQMAWNNVNSDVTSPFPQTIVKLCCAHFVKAAATRLNRCVNRKDIRQATLVMLCRMQQCQTLSRAAAVYRAVKQILCSEVETDAVHAAKGTLLTHSDVEALTTQYPDLCVGDMDTAGVTAVNLRKKSPFALFFGQLPEHDDVSDMSESAEKLNANHLYSPAAFKVVTDLLPYFPLWSCVLERRASVTPKVHSNAVVESHFRQLKVTTLRNRTRLRPGEVVRQELTYVRAKLNHMWLAEAVSGRDTATEKSRGRTGERKRRAGSRQSSADAYVEKWSRRRRAAGYSSPTVARRKLLVSDVSGPTTASTASTRDR